MQSKRIVIRNIGKLLQVSNGNLEFRRGEAMNQLPFITDAFLTIVDGKIHAFGPNHEAPLDGYEMMDANQGYVMPGLIDAHTHLVFAEWRNREFEDRIRGLSYQEIAARGGGILNSAAKLNQLSEDELFDRSFIRLKQAMARGTLALEIKSGYGLSTESELKILRVIHRLKSVVPIPIKSTFLGAHSFPMKYRENHDGYLREIIEEMLPRIASEQLADFCDVFCEKGFYSPEETDRILTAAAQYGLKARVHTNQFTHSGGLEIALKHGSISVDHLEVLNDDEIQLLKKGTTHPVLLPFAAFFMNLEYPPARKMIDSGLGVVLASDFNPGTSPNADLAWVWGLACNQMKMTPIEALNALTINPAINLGIDGQTGTIAIGNDAHLLLTKPIPDLSFIPYQYGNSWLSKIFVRGNPDFLDSDNLN